MLKMIDLLNMIASGAELPEKIEFDGNILLLDETIREYLTKEDENGNISDLTDLADRYTTRGFLDTEVNIVLTDDDIFDIQKIKMLEGNGAYNKEINELIKAVKQLDISIKQLKE